jgi:AraC-like DNA-binding protein
VGVAPKLACRVARFRAAVSLLHDRPRTDLSAVAFDAGYADQPHLTREFRALAGMTPGAYRRRHAAQSPGPGA